MFSSLRFRGALAGVFAALVAAATANCTGDVVEAIPIGELPSDPQIAVEPVVHVNDGKLCLYAGHGPELPFGDGEAQVFTVGDRLVAQVRTRECLSMSCDIDREATCAITRQGDHIEIRSTLRYHELVDVDACTMECGVLAATCASDPLAEGRYEVQLGDRLTTLTVPSTVDTACVAEDECLDDGDCRGGYCGLGTNDRRVCKTYAGAGEICHGLMPTELNRRCAPGLVCIHDDPFSDMPGFCWATCSSNADCPGGICFEDGPDHVPVCQIVDS